MSRALIPRNGTRLPVNSRGQDNNALLPARQQVQHMQRLAGLGYLAGRELTAINRLLAEHEQVVLEVIALRVQEAEANGQKVENAEEKAYQLFQAFSERLTNLEEVAGQVIADLLASIERRSP